MGENGKALAGGLAGLLPEGGETPNSRRVGLDLLLFLEGLEERGEAPSYADLKVCADAARELVASPKVRTKSIGVQLTVKLREMATKRGLGVIAAAKSDPAPTTIIERTVIFGGDWCQSLVTPGATTSRAALNGRSGPAPGQS